jgi:hypothetical protein
MQAGTDALTLQDRQVAGLDRAHPPSFRRKHDERDDGRGRTRQFGNHGAYREFQHPSDATINRLAAAFEPGTVLRISALAPPMQAQLAAPYPPPSH